MGGPNVSGNLTDLQIRLLHHPGDRQAWQELRRRQQDAPAAGSSPQRAAVAKVPQVQPPAPREAPAAREPAPLVDLNQRRPLNPRFAAPGSSRWEAAERELRGEWLERVRGERFEEATRLFDPGRVKAWCGDLEPLAQYRFGHWCHEQGAHEQAVLVLDHLVARGDAAELGLWGQLAALRSLLLLGRLSEAKEPLPALVAGELLDNEEAAGTMAEARRQVAFHATLSQAWLQLVEGDAAAAQQSLELLRASALVAENTAEVDLLGRVISTLAWLEEYPRDQLSHGADRIGFAMAVDTIQLSNCGTLLRLKGWMLDPGNQIEHLCLIRGSRVHRLQITRAHYWARPDLGEVMARCGCAPGYEAGFSLALVLGPEERLRSHAGESMELLVVLRNGEQFLVRRVAVVSELSSAELKQAVDSVFSNSCELLAPEAAVKLRHAWSALVRQRMKVRPQVRRWGPVPERPDLSVVVPLYGRIDFMDYQLNWFNAWLRRGGEEALRYQLIYVLDDPRLKDAFEALSRRCQALYGMPFETVLNASNLGFAGANNVGAEQARSEVLLLLNSDVLPANQHSLALMLRAWRQHEGRIGALGARLLFDNGGLQHAGMEFVRQNDLPGRLSEVWLNEHPMKGLKLEFAAEERLALQEVEAATAACLMLDTALFREIGGLSTDFVIGDFEDSDLCLRVRQRGLPVLVDLEASFYHLERQSVGHGESGDLLKTKVVAMNACTQQEKWGGSIELLQRSRLEAVG